MASDKGRVLYADSSALVKLIRAEPETRSLVEFVDHHSLASASIVLTEIPRAIRRAAHRDSRLSVETLIDRAGNLLDAIALVPLDEQLLSLAGAIDDPELRSLDAMHIAAAAAISPIDAFVTYDERQLSAARSAGLTVASPGV